MLWISLTQHPQAPNFVHQQSRDDVARQHGQSAEEVDKVYHVGIVEVVAEVQHAALLVVQKGAVDQFAVDKPVFEQVW